MGAVRTSGSTGRAATSTAPGTSKYSVVATLAGGSQAGRGATVVVVAGTVVVVGGAVVVAGFVTTGGTVTGSVGTAVVGTGIVGTVTAGTVTTGVVVVAPATADLMAKMANGHADDLASTILLATDRPVLVAPAMNPKMWAHPATRRNRATLARDGIRFIGPEAGEMAESGEAGEGRMSEPLSIVRILGWMFYPFAFLLGLQSNDVPVAARLLGERVILTEVFSYNDLSQLISTGQISDPRTVVILTYALCGFAHIAAMAIFVGGTAALAPTRRDDLASLGPRALLAATLATLMTGCIAGIFSGSESVLLIRPS